MEEGRIAELGGVDLVRDVVGQGREGVVALVVETFCQLMDPLGAGHELLGRI